MPATATSKSRSVELRTLINPRRCRRCWSSSSSGATSMMKYSSSARPNDFQTRFCSITLAPGVILSSFNLSSATLLSYWESLSSEKATLLALRSSILPYFSHSSLASSQISRITSSDRNSSLRIIACCRFCDGRFMLNIKSLLYWRAPLSTSFCDSSYHCQAIM